MWLFGRVVVKFKDSDCEGFKLILYADRKLGETPAMVFSEGDHHGFDEAVDWKLALHEVPNGRQSLLTVENVKLSLALRD